MVKSINKKPAKKAQETKHTAKGGSGKGFNPSQQKILDIVAGLKAIGKDEVTRKQVASLAELGKSTFANALTVLKNGYLIVTPQTLQITEKGLEHTDADAIQGKIAMTNEQHHEKIMEHFKLKPKARELIAELVDGAEKDKKETAEKIGKKINSTFANMLTDLKKKEIIVFDKKTIKLHDSMFPFGRP